jgi:hypothetical protein
MEKLGQIIIIPMGGRGVIIVAEHPEHQPIAYQQFSARQGVVSDKLD